MNTQINTKNNKNEFKITILLALIFCLIITCCWILSTMKYSIFNALIGMSFLPYAKIISLSAMIPFMFFYNRLFNTVSRNRLFYSIVGFHITIALIMFFCLSHHTIGIANTTKDPMRIIGWIWYMWVECFASSIVALFWAITTDITSPQSAEKSFFQILLCGQLGNIVGPYILNAKRLGFLNSIPMIIIISAILCLITVLFYLCMTFTQKNDTLQNNTNKESTTEKHSLTVFESLTLVLTHRYLLSIATMIMVYEIISTVLDFHFKMNVATAFSTEIDVNAYLAHYATMVGIISFICLLINSIGFSKIIGLKGSLFILPFSLGISLLLLLLYPQSLMVSFWVTICAKSFNYAFSKPALKQLYIPTSKNIKYVCQAIMEMFGMRFAQSTSSAINASRSLYVAWYGLTDGIVYFLALNSILFFTGIGAWCIAIICTTTMRAQAIKNDTLIS